LGACPYAPYAFTSKGSLQTAAQEYNANVATATAAYGPIAEWDVSAINDMSELFKDLNSFNADISSWDTSSVTDMGDMFNVRSARAPASRLHSRVLCLHAACAAAGHTPSHLPVRLSPLF
jgi:surface protein